MNIFYHRAKTLLSHNTIWLQKVLVIVLFLIFAFDSLTFPTENNESEKVFAPPEETLGYPVELFIPVLNIRAHIQQVGVTPLGAMDVPSNIVDVGWFQYGPRPGAVGSAVISGHLNGPGNEPGVFARLNTLKKGDRVHVTSETQRTQIFEVREVRDYDPGRADEVFTQNDIAHLNLITCEGVWDKKNRTYSKRRVVFTDLIQ